MKEINPFEETFEKLGVKPQARSYIGGVWTSGIGESFPVYNPSTGEILGYCSDCSVEQIDVAFQEAEKSQIYWQLMTGQQEKEKIFETIWQGLEKWRGPLAQAMAQESGKRIIECDGDITESIDTDTHYHGEHSRNIGEANFSQMPNKHMIVERFPMTKPVLAIAPFNFPMAIPCWKIFQALAGGNAVILKTSSNVPFTSSFLVKIIHDSIEKVLGKKKAKKLNALVQVIHGRGSTVGELLIKHGGYGMIAFTGGVETGRRIAATAGQRLVPNHLELGGHNRMIIMPDFPMKKAVDEADLAWRGTTKQRCVSLQAAFVHEEVFDEFTFNLIEQIRKHKIGDAVDPETVIGPIMTRHQMIDIPGFINRAREEGLTPVIGGYPLNAQTVKKAKEEGFNFKDSDFQTGGRLAKGNFFVPTIYLNPPLDAEIMKKEIFGPVLCIVPFSAKTETGKDWLVEELLEERNGIGKNHPERNKFESFLKAVMLMNDNDYGLSNSVLTTDMRLTMLAFELVESGLLYIGRGPTGAQVPGYFGGIKNSGYGKEGKGIEATTWLKQAYFDTHPTTRMAQIGKLKSLKKLLKTAKSPLASN